MFERLPNLFKKISSGGEKPETSFHEELETTLPAIEAVGFKQQLLAARAELIRPKRKVYTDRYKLPKDYKQPQGKYEMIADDIDPGQNENFARVFSLLGYNVELPGMYSLFILTPKNTLQNPEKYTLRLRKDGEVLSFTVKGPLKEMGSVKNRQEEEVILKNNDHILKFFKNQGIQSYSHVDKYRETFKLGDCTFEIDEYPSEKVKPRAEVEAVSAEKIQQGLSAINYTGKQLAIGESKYLKDQGLSPEEAKNLRFKDGKTKT